MKYLLRLIKIDSVVLGFLAGLGMVRATHEIAKFRPNYSWLPQWVYPFGITSPPLDSYHVYGGLFVLVLLFGLKTTTRSQTLKWYEGASLIVVEFLVYFWVFDLFYHGIFMKPEFMDWSYVVPFYKLIEGLI